jgi:hypothetical protein
MIRSESVNRRRTDNTMAKKSTKGKTTIYTTFGTRHRTKTNKAKNTTRTNERMNNDLQTYTKPKDQVTRTLLIPGGELRCYNAI